MKKQLKSDLDTETFVGNNEQRLSTHNLLYVLYFPYIF